MNHSFDHIAFELFRRWSKNAASDYPDYDFTIINEQCLVKDLRDAQYKAIQHLLINKNGEKKKPTYDTGFVLGYMEGSLNTLWCKEYLVCRSDDYKNFMACKALFEFIKIDEVTGYQINSLYENLIQDGLNLSDFDTSIKEKEIEKFGINKTPRLINDKNRFNSILIFLENKLKEQLLAVLNSINTNYLPCLRNFFTQDYILKQILWHEKNFSL